MGELVKDQEDVEAEVVINVTERGIQKGDVRGPILCQVAGFDICDV